MFKLIFLLCALNGSCYKSYGPTFHSVMECNRQSQMFLATMVKENEYISKITCEKNE